MGTNLCIVLQDDVFAPPFVNVVRNDGERSDQSFWGGMWVFVMKGVIFCFCHVKYTTPISLNPPPIFGMLCSQNSGIPQNRVVLNAMFSLIWPLSLKY